MRKTLTVLLSLCVISMFVLTFSAQPVMVARGGVTPENLPWNKQPSRNPTAQFSATPAGSEVSATALSKLALIIGISDYAGTSSDLNYCDDDALEVRDTLVTKYGFSSSSITLLLDTQATDANIRAGIEWLVANSGPDSHVVFYYSGHGSRSTKNMDDDPEKQDECIIPHELSRIWDGELANYFARLTSNYVWIAFDSCYSGGMDDIADKAGADKVVTMACAEGEYSYESSSIGHGYFTWLMVERGMRLVYGDADGNGVVTVEEGFNYCVLNIGAYTRRQHPVMADGFSGELIP